MFSIMTKVKTPSLSVYLEPDITQDRTMAKNLQQELVFTSFVLSMWLSTSLPIQWHSSARSRRFATSLLTFLQDVKSLQPDKRLFIPSEVYTTVKKMSDSDLLLGLLDEYAHPEWIIIMVLPVPLVRPSITHQRFFISMWYIFILQSQLSCGNNRHQRSLQRGSTYTWYFHQISLFCF